MTSTNGTANKMRARRIMDLPLDFIPNETFPNVGRGRQERKILGPAPAGDGAPAKPRLPGGLPPYLASLYEVPLLSRDQEVHLFRKMNYLKYKAARLRAKLDPSRPDGRLMNRIERLHEQAVATKNRIISANLRLVVSIAKQYVGPMQSFFELVSDGNMSLMRAVEKFDYSRGNKFSTYATWAITKNFARSIPCESRHHGRFRTSLAEAFAGVEDQRSSVFEQESAQRQRKAQVSKIVNYLDERERWIIAARFGLNGGREPLTLKQAGEELGVTKERIRQLVVRALNKLRRAAEEERIELPESV